jgi:hypothetical protein
MNGYREQNLGRSIGQNYSPRQNKWLAKSRSDRCETERARTRLASSAKDFRRDNFTSLAEQENVGRYRRYYASGRSYQSNHSAKSRANMTEIGAERFRL